MRLIVKCPFHKIGKRVKSGTQAPKDHVSQSLKELWCLLGLRPTPGLLLDCEFALPACILLLPDFFLDGGGTIQPWLPRASCRNWCLHHDMHTFFTTQLS